MSQERRQSPRAAFPCKITVTQRGKTLSSHIDNLSKGGIKVILDEAIEPMTNVDIELFLKKDDPIICKGTIMWVKEERNPLEKNAIMFSTGIMFKNLEQKYTEYIGKLVNSLLT